MSDTAERVATEETAYDPGTSASPPPSPSYSEKQLPPDYEAPPMYPEPKPEETFACQLDMDEKSFANVNPEDPTHTVPVDSSVAFEDNTVRSAFVRKVFSILALQLLFTFCVVCVFTFSSVVKKAVQDNFWIYISSFIIFVVVAVVIAFSTSLRRRHPWNIISLAVVTISLSYTVGTVASFHDTSSVLIAMGTTLAVSFAIIIFSAQTYCNFSMCYGFALIVAVDLIMFGFFSIFYYSAITEIVYGCLGALLYSLFLIIDCQLIMWGISASMDPEEYISAALKVYLDIIIIFIYLMGWRK